MIIIYACAALGDGKNEEFLQQPIYNTQYLLGSSSCDSEFKTIQAVRGVSQNLR